MFILKEDIVFVYKDYIEFIIDRDRAREGAIYHEFNKIFSDIRQSQYTSKILGLFL